MSIEKKQVVSSVGLASSSETLPVQVGGEMSRTGNFAPQQRTSSRISLTILAIVIVWFALDAVLGLSGFFSEHTRLITLFVLTPIIVFVVAFVVSRSVQAWAFAFDIRTLVFFQAVRTGGIAFLAVYAVGKLNGEFALWAGLLDAATGFSALFAAHYLTPAQTAKQRGLLIAWMAVGILDFVVAFL